PRVSPPPAKRGANRSGCAMAPLTESQWAEVRTNLPNGADEAGFRIELERILSDTMIPPKIRQQIHFKRAQLCRSLMCELPYLEHIKDKNAFAKQLGRQQQEEENLAEKYRRIAARSISARPGTPNAVSSTQTRRRQRQTPAVPAKSLAVILAE